MRRHNRFRSQRVQAFVFGMGALARLSLRFTSWQAGQHTSVLTWYTKA